MTEGKWVAESKSVGDVCDRLIRGRQQQGSRVGSSTFEIPGERFSHGRLKQIGTILLRVAQKLRQEFERQSFVQVAADKFRDLFGKAFRAEQRVMFGCEDGGQIEKLADRFQKFTFSFSPSQSISRFGGMPAELSCEVPKAIGENCRIRLFSHRGGVWYATG